MNKAKDYAGQRFGRLVALRPTAERRERKVVWECVCDCGSKAYARSTHLANGMVKSCGCLLHKPLSAERRQKLVAAATIHGYARGGRVTSTFQIWSGAHARCFNPKNKAYKNYGDRGITVCDRWRGNFAAFLADMGERPHGLTLERVNNDGNYEPDNCKWATIQEQNKNRRIRRGTDGRYQSATYMPDVTIDFEPEQEQTNVQPDGTW